MKRKVKTDSNLPVRLTAAERPVLLGIADKLGLTYKSRPSVGQILHYLASGKALIMLHALDTSAEMRDVAQRARVLAATQPDSDQVADILLSAATALDRAAVIREEFEKAESDEVHDDYQNR